MRVDAAERPGGFTLDITEIGWGVGPLQARGALVPEGDAEQLMPFDEISSARQTLSTAPRSTESSVAAEVSRERRCQYGAHRGNWQSLGFGPPFGRAEASQPVAKRSISPVGRLKVEKARRAARK